MSRIESRWTYTNGSRPEGVAVYDSDTSITSHHDSDPARGTHNAFDLVRLHKFGHLDVGHEEKPMSERPSFRAMLEMANEREEIRAARAKDAFKDLDKQPEPTPAPTLESEIRFQFKRASEFSGGPSLDWLVRDVLPRAELAVVFGDSGAGKSFLVLDLVCAVTRGVAWTGRRVRKGRVGYIAAEGARGMRKRIDAYKQHHGATDADLPWVLADAPNLLTEKDAKDVIAGILAAGPFDAVVVDVLAAVMPGGNESSSEHMGLLLHHCKLINKATGALIILIHHSGKDAAKGARGWSGLRAAADAEIEVTRNGLVRAWTATKMKDDKDDGVGGAFKLDVVTVGTDEYFDAITSCVVNHDVQKVPVLKTASPKGAKLARALGAIKKAIAANSGGPVHLEAARATAAETMPEPEPGKRDRRGGRAGECINELVHQGFLFRTPDKLISDTQVIAGDDI